MEKIEKLNNELPEFFLDDLESRLETDPLSLVGMSQSMTDFCFVNRNPENQGFCVFNHDGANIGACIFNFGAHSDDLQTEDIEEPILDEECPDETEPTPEPEDEE
ncbi:MAG: hypothetical protein J6T70_09240 [Bacteroidales bacterium]|nr:hypothetical protein [Bacteroidales bacterium]